MDAYQAGQQLGTLLFGNGDQPSFAAAVTGQAAHGAPYYRALGTGGRAYEALAAARGARARAMIGEDQLAHRSALPASIGAVYTNPAQAKLLGDLLLSNASPSLSQAGIMQNPNEAAALGDAASAMRSGDFPTYNQAVALAANKPYQPVIVHGETMLPNGVSLGDAAFQAQATPVGSATIGMRNAEANAATALANERDARTNFGTAVRGAAPRTGKPSALTKTDLGMLGDLVSDVSDPAHGTINARGQQDLAMLGANPTAAMKAWLMTRQPLSGAPMTPGESIPLANYATLPAVTAAPNFGGAPLADAATGAPTSFENDPRVQKLLQQASDAVNNGHADPQAVQGRLQQEFAKLGYKPQAVAGGG